MSEQEKIVGSDGLSIEVEQTFTWKACIAFLFGRTFHQVIRVETAAEVQDGKIVFSYGRKGMDNSIGKRPKRK